MEKTNTKYYLTKDVVVKIDTKLGGNHSKHGF